MQLIVLKEAGGEVRPFSQLPGIINRIDEVLPLRVIQSFEGLSRGQDIIRGARAIGPFNGPKEPLIVSGTSSAMMVGSLPRVRLVTGVQSRRLSLLFS